MIALWLVEGLSKHIVSYTSGRSSYSPMCYFEIIALEFNMGLIRNNTMGVTRSTWSVAHNMCWQAFHQSQSNHQQKAWYRLYSILTLCKIVRAYGYSPDYSTTELYLVKNAFETDFNMYIQERGNNSLSLVRGYLNSPHTTQTQRNVDYRTTGPLQWLASSPV